MKKTFLLTVLISFMVCGTALAIDALADNAVTAGPGRSIYGGVDAADAVSGSAILLGRMSKGVNFVGDVDADDTDGDGALGSGYAIATKHEIGSKQYGTAHDSTAIFFKDVGDTALGAIGGEDKEIFVTNSWTAM